MNVEQKISVGFVAIVIIIVIFGVGILLNEKSIETVTSHFSDEIVIELKLLDELKSSALRVLSSSMEFAFLMSEKSFATEEEEEMMELISQGKTDFENAFNILHDLTSGDLDEFESIINIKKEWKIFIGLSENFIELKKSGVHGKEILDLTEQLDEAETNLLISIDKSIDHEIEEVAEQTRIIKSSFDTNFQFILLGVVGIITASLITGKIISGRIKNDQTTITQQLEDLRKVDKQKDEFLGMLSHELRTPLVPIKGICGVLLHKDSEKLSEKQRKLIQSVASNSQRLDALIDKLLLAQKLELGKYDYQMKNLNVKDFMNDINTSYSPIMSERHIEFVSSTKDVSVVYGDEKSIHQIFNNLINNALDFVPKENARIERKQS